MNESVAKTTQTGVSASTRLDHNNVQTVMNFGIESQRKLGSVSDELLTKVKGKDAGEAGQAITDLLVTIKRIDVTEPTNPFVKFLSVLPFMKTIMDKSGEVLTRYQSVKENVDGIVTRMEDSRRSLIHDNSSMTVMLERQKEHILDLQGDIAEGEAKIVEMKATHIPELKAKIEASGNSDFSLDLQLLNDYTNFTEKLEKKISNMKTARIIALQSLPQIRIIQTNNETLISDIQDMIQSTIPLWRQQIVLALSLNRQQEISTLNQMASQTTNDMLRKNSEILKTNSIEIAKQNERGIVDLETLKTVNTNLLATLTEVQKVKDEGAKQRALAGVELAKLEQQLNQTILNVAQSTVTQASTPVERLREIE